MDKSYKIKSFHFFLLGPNGSGKTSIFNNFFHSQNSIYGDSFPNINNKDFTFIDQTLLNIYPSSRVESSLLIPQIIGNIPIAVANYNLNIILEKFNISYIRNKRITELSGGEFKLVNILTGLLTGKKGLIIEDPFGMLDEDRTQTLIQQINDLYFSNDLKQVIMNMPDSHENYVCDIKKKNFIVYRLESTKNYQILSEILHHAIQKNFVHPINNLEIKIDNLTFDEKIIKHPSLDRFNQVFKPSNLYHIRGTNGKGKSLFLSALVGKLPHIIKMSSGSILIDNKIIYNATNKYQHKRSSRSITSQMFLIPQNCHYLFLYELPNEIINNQLQGVFSSQEIDELKKLSFFWERPTLEASLGEIRFFTLIYAIISFIRNAKYSWLLLDEPDSFLDINHKKILSSLVKLITELGKGVIVVSHDKEMLNDAIPINL